MESIVIAKEAKIEVTSCKICGEDFSNNRDLIVHKLSHLKDLYNGTQVDFFKEEKKLVMFLYYC